MLWKIKTIIGTCDNGKNVKFVMGIKNNYVTWRPYNIINIIVSIFEQLQWKIKMVCGITHKIMGADL